MFGVVPSYTPVDEQERARFIPACPLLVERICKANQSESKARPIHTRLAKDLSLMAHVALPELHCSSLFCATPFATESYRCRLVGRMSIVHVPLPQNQKKHNNKDAVTVKHFQAANHAFWSQDSEDYYQ